VRFVEWNTCGGLATSVACLQELGCDAAVLCEVPSTPPAPSLTDPAIDWQWAGDLASKGLALAAFGTKLTPQVASAGAGAFGIAATMANDVGLLGIWTQAPNYGDQAARTIEAHADWLRETPGIVAGDFNVAPRGTEDTRTGVLQRIFDSLDRLGYSSVYHHHFNEVYGSETRPTYFHRRKAEDPFHIDFCFVHKSLLPQVRRVEVGDYGRWVARSDPRRPGFSDHVPMMVDIDV
jgi:hypothetical protein